MVHLLLNLQLVMKNAQMSLAKGFFALFPTLKKREGGFALESEGARQWQLIHAGCSARIGLVEGVTHTCSAGRVGGCQGSEEGALEQEEEEEEEEEAVAGVLRATSSSFRNSCSEIWTLFYEPFVLAVSCSVSWCCLVQQWIQSLCQFSEALVFFLIFYVLDSDPEVVPESGHSSTHPWYLAATGSVFALPGIYRKIGFSASPLHLAVTFLCLVLPLEYRTMDFWGDDSRSGFRTQHSSV